MSFLVLFYLLRTQNVPSSCVHIHSGQDSGITVSAISTISTMSPPLNLENIPRKIPQRHAMILTAVSFYYILTVMMKTDKSDVMIAF